jgi:hypothetical protein
MRFKEIVDEAGLIGKIGSVVGKAAKGVGTVAGVAAGAAQQFKQGADKWKGTGVLGGPNTSTKDKPGSDTTNPALQDVDPEDLKQILAAATQGKQLDGKLLQVASSLQQKL